MRREWELVGTILDFSLLRLRSCSLSNIMRRQMKDIPCQPQPHLIEVVVMYGTTE